MATVKGQNLRIFLGNGDGLPIAAALDCSLQIQLNVQERSTKDDEGGWTKNHAVSLSWNVNATSVVTDVDYVEAMGINDIMDLIGQQVFVQLATASGEQNRDKNSILVAGYAIVSDIQITAQNRQRGTYTFALTGIKNLINELRLIVTSDGHAIETSDGHTLVAAHGET